MAINLFAGGARGGSSTIEFRAGKLNRQGTTITADPRKGKITIGPGEHGLTQFTWTDRTTNQREDSILILPNEATWKRVKECTTGRVFCLEMSDRKRFYWMQEPKESEDDALTEKITAALNRLPSSQNAGLGGMDMSQLAGITGLPPELAQMLQGLGGAGESGGDGGAMGDFGGMGGGDAGMSEEDAIAQAIALSLQESQNAQTPAESSPASGDATTTAPVTEATSAELAPPIPADDDGDDEEDEDLAAAMALSMAEAEGQADAPPASGAAQSMFNADLMARLQQSLAGARGAQEAPVGLSDVLQSDRVVPLLEEDKEAVAELRQFLPEGQQTDAEVLSVIRSPQMKQAMGMLSYAFNTGNSAAIMHDLALDPNTPPGVLAFLRALQKKMEEDGSTRTNMDES